MFSISLFFEKLKQADLDRGIRTNEIIRTIENQTNVILKSEEVEISSNGNIKIKSTPVKRNEIFMSKERILTALRSDGAFVKDLF